jgi:hypothetical protein
VSSDQLGVVGVVLDEQYAQGLRDHGGAHSSVRGGRTFQTPQ